MQPPQEYKRRPVLYFWSFLFEDWFLHVSQKEEDLLEKILKIPSALIKKMLSCLIVRRVCRSTYKRQKLVLLQCNWKLFKGFSISKQGSISILLDVKLFFARVTFLFQVEVEFLVEVVVD